MQSRGAWQSFELLLGRRTYDIWSASPKAPSSPMSDALNAATKYMATHRPKTLNGARSRALGRTSSGHSPHQVAQRPRPDPLGSSTLTSTLLEHGLADEVLLFVYPVLLGKGKRFFAEGTPPRAFELASTKALSSGIVMNAYKAAGPLKNQP